MLFRSYNPVVTNELAVRTRSGNILIYNTETEAVLFNRTVIQVDPVFPKNDLAYSPSGTHLAIGSGNHVIIVDVGNEQIPDADILLEVGHEIKSLSYNQDGSHLAIGTNAGVFIYETQTYQQVKEIPDIHVDSLLYGPNSIAIINTNSSLFIWNFTFPPFIGKGKGEILLLWIAYCVYTQPPQKTYIQDLSYYIIQHSPQMIAGYWPTLLEVYNGLSQEKKQLLKQCFGLLEK